MTKYIDYHHLKDFYSISEASKVLGLSKGDFQRICRQNDIALAKNRSGTLGLYRSNFRYLHYKLYHEDRRQVKR